MTAIDILEIAKKDIEPIINRLKKHKDVGHIRNVTIQLARVQSYIEGTIEDINYNKEVYNEKI